MLSGNFFEWIERFSLEVILVGGRSFIAGVMRGRIESASQGFLSVEGVWNQIFWEK